MTPTAWVEERARQWAEWVDKNTAGARGYSIQSVLAGQVGSGSAYSTGGCFSMQDDDRHACFEAAVNLLPDSLRVIFKMHWLGSEGEKLPAVSPVEMKAAVCGVSRAGYYRRLEDANLLIYQKLR